MPNKDIKDKTKVYTQFEASKIQEEGQGIPYAELFKAYTESLTPSELEEFGKKTPLGQRMAIATAINPDYSDSSSFMLNNTLARRALSNMHSLDSSKSLRPTVFPLDTDYDLLKARADSLAADSSVNNDPAFRLYGDKGFRNIVGKTAEELNKSISSLASTTKKDVDLQKLKEKQGTDFISDKDFYEGNVPFVGTIPSERALKQGEETISQKYANDLARDKSIYNIPQNTISAEDSAKAMDKLKAKQEYQQGTHPVDFLLGFTPLSPIAVAAENGEPLSRGLAGAGASVAGGGAGVALAPFITPYGSAAVIGAANAYGDEIARGERPDELTAGEMAKSYLIPTGIGAALGAGMAGAGAAIPKKLRSNASKKLDKELDQAIDQSTNVSNDLAKAKADYDNINANKWRGQPFNANKLTMTDEEKEALEATKRVMAQVEKGKFNEIDVGDIQNMVINPSNAEQIVNALALQKQAFSNEEARVALLKKLNSDPKFINTIKNVLGESNVPYDMAEGGYEYVTGLAREGAPLKSIDEQIADLVNYPQVSMGNSRNIAASKPLYTAGGAPMSQNAGKTISAAYGFDERAKGPVLNTDPYYEGKQNWLKDGLIIRDVNESMKDLPKETRSMLGETFIPQYIIKDNGVAFARAAADQAQSIVREASEGILEKSIKDPEQLKALMNEYLGWTLPSNASPIDVAKARQEFIFSVKAALNKSGDGYSYMDPDAIKVADVQNRGNDVLRLLRNSTSDLKTNDNIGRLSFNALKPNKGSNATPRTDEIFFDNIQSALDKGNAALREGDVSTSAYGYLGGLERPSANARGIFTGRKDRNKFNFTIEPEFQKTLETNLVPTMNEVRAAGQRLDDLTKLHKSTQEALKQKQRDVSAQKEALSKLPPSQQRAIAPLGYLPNVYASEGAGLSNAEETTRQEELSKDPRAKALSDVLDFRIPLAGSLNTYVGYKPKAKEARSRGNAMPYRYLYIPTR